MLMHHTVELASHVYAAGILKTIGHAIGAVLLGVLVVAQLRSSQPMLDLRLFGDPSFRRASLVLFMCVAGFLGTLYGFTLMYQTALGASAWETGLVTLPK